MTTPTPDRDVLVAAHEDAADFYRRALLGPEGSGPRDYLTGRGFGALIEDTRWTVGYAPPGWTRLRDHLINIGYHEDTLRAAGLTRLSRRGTPIDCFRDRITFGIRDLDGALVGFTARCSPEAPGHVPKYLNTGTTALYDKGRVLFGLGEAARKVKGGAVVITEGPLDAIAADLSIDHRDYARRPLALCGTAMSEAHKRALTALQPMQLILAFDGDAAGGIARENVYRILRGSTTIDTVDPPTATDLAEILRRAGPTAVNSMLADTRPAIDAIIDARLEKWPNRSTNAEAAISCLRSLARLINDLKPDDIARQATKIGDTTRLPVAVVTRELADAATIGRRE